MSSNQQSSSPPVVQMVLESFTRCFNPLDHSGCSKSDSTKKDGGNGSGSSSSRSPRGPISPTSSQLFGLNIGSGTEGVASTLARAISRSSSSSDSRKQKLQLDVSYDADGVAKAKKSHQKIMLSKEQLEERSMKRKLEIFRGTGKEVSRPPPKIQPRQHSARASPPLTPVSSSAGGAQNVARIKSVTGADLTLSDDEEELIRQQQSRKRFACGMNITRDSDGPISNMARLFNFGISEAQKPFGLCFATPVRTSSQEDIANLSDDKLTDDEFLRRHCNDGVGGGENNAAMVSPVDGSDHSYCEEETISSTLYFDQKYSHMVEKRPPMPLFQENMLHCTETKFDEITSVIQRQRSPGSNDNTTDHPPVDQVISKNRNSPSRKKGRVSPFRRSNNGNVSRPSSKSPTSGGSRSPFKGGDKPPSPVRIRDESLSMNTQSADEEIMVGNPATSAEI